MCADTVSCLAYVANCDNQSLVPCSGNIQNPDLQYEHDKIAIPVQHVLSQFSTTNEEIVELSLDEESETKSYAQGNNSNDDVPYPMMKFLKYHSLMKELVMKTYKIHKHLIVKI